MHGRHNESGFHGFRRRDPPATSTLGVAGVLLAAAAEGPRCALPRRADGRALILARFDDAGMDRAASWARRLAFDGCHAARRALREHPRLAWSAPRGDGLPGAGRHARRVSSRPVATYRVRRQNRTFLFAHSRANQNLARGDTVVTAPWSARVPISSSDQSARQPGDGMAAWPVDSG